MWHHNYRSNIAKDNASWRTRFQFDFGCDEEIVHLAHGKRHTNEQSSRQGGSSPTLWAWKTTRKAQSWLCTIKVELSAPSPIHSQHLRRSPSVYVTYLQYSSTAVLHLQWISFPPLTPARCFTALESRVDCTQHWTMCLRLMTARGVSFKSPNG